MNAFLQLLGRLTVFMVCAQLIVCFRPKESYEKYLKLLMTGLILLQFLQPVQRLLSMETTDLEGALLEFQTRFYELDGEAWLQERSGGWGEGALPEEPEQAGDGVEITPVEEVTIHEIMAGGDDES